MIDKLFEFTIVSAYDREKLTCEICYKNEFVAEISQETGELYPQAQCLEIPLKEFQQALEDGKNFLFGNK